MKCERLRSVLSIAPGSAHSIKLSRSISSFTAAMAPSCVAAVSTA